MDNSGISSNSGTSSNINGSDIFFSVYRNSYLKSHINSFNYSGGSGSTFYENPRVLYSLVNNRQYSLLLDILKSNTSRVIVVQSGLSKLLSDFYLNPLFEEIFQLLWVNYNQVIKKLNPLKLLLSQKDSTFLFKYIFNKYYLNDNNSDADVEGANAKSIDGGGVINYKLIDLLECFKSNQDAFQDNIGIAEFILSLFKDQEQQALVSEYQDLLVSIENSGGSINQMSTLLESLDQAETISILFKSIINKNIESINSIITSKSTNNNNNSNIPTTLYNNSSSNKSNYNNSLEIIKYLHSNGYLNGFDLELVLKWIVENMAPEKEFVFSLIPSDHIKLVDHYNEYYYNFIKIGYNDINDDQQQQQQQIKDITDTKSLINALQNGYYQAVMDYVEKNGTSELNLSKRWILQASLSRSYSSEWFTKLYEPFIRKEMDLGMQSVLRLAAVNNYEIFEFIWKNYLVSDQLKIEFIKELFSITQDVIGSGEDDQDERNITNNEDEINIPLIEYFLTKKSEFIIQQFKINSIDDYLANLLLQHSLIFGSISIFNKLLSLFKKEVAEDSSSSLSFNFVVNFKFLKQLIKYTDSAYSCDVIKFLDHNSYLSNLYQVIQDKLILHSYELFIISRSIKVLLNSITKQ